MKVHHLNCGTMAPPLTPRLVAHVLLVELPDRLLLVDTGFGLQDIAQPGPRLGASRHLIRPVLEPAETAYEQVRALGLDPHDVRDIVLTHFDSDHVGGLSDFPWAQVHLTSAEAIGAFHSPTRAERLRFPPAQRAHEPKLVEHGTSPETWRGLAASPVADGILLVPLAGHTRGHAAVAVEADAGWVLHAGDAFYDRRELTGAPGVPPTLRAMERLIAFDWGQVRDNQERLRELYAAGDPDLLIISAHDPVLYAEAAGRP